MVEAAELDITAVADAVAEATNSGPAVVPRPLPNGWILKESRSSPGCFYYFYIPTGLSSWQAPLQNDTATDSQQTEATERERAPLTAKADVPSTLDKTEGAETQHTDAEEAEDRASKRRKPTSTSGPKEVRVLHILKKHKDSRRPASWRKASITAVSNSKWLIRLCIR